jgi:hypothetical protein
MLICTPLEIDQEAVRNIGSMFRVSAPLIDGALEPSLRVYFIISYTVKSPLVIGSMRRHRDL